EYMGLNEERCVIRRVVDDGVPALVELPPAQSGEGWDDGFDQITRFSLSPAEVSPSLRADERGRGGWGRIGKSRPDHGSAQGVEGENEPIAPPPQLNDNRPERPFRGGRIRLHNFPGIVARPPFQFLG